MADEEDGGRRKRIDLSASQVVGGGVATMTAATAASYLGVYGTVIGAAVMSVISTAGTAVVAHYMQQGGQKARGLAVRRPRPEPGGDSARGSLARSGPGAADGDALLAAATEDTEDIGDDQPQRAGPPRPEVEETRALPLLGADGASGATEEFEEARAAHGDRSQGAAATGTATATGAPGRRLRRPGWRGVAVSAAALFLGVMGVILVVELITGQSLSDTVHGRQTASAPTILGGGSGDEGQDGSDPAPEATPTGGTQQDGGQDGDAPGGPTAPEGEQQPEEGPSQAPQQPGTGDGGQETDEQETSAPQDGTGDTGEQQPEGDTGGDSDTGGSDPGAQGGVSERLGPTP